MIDKNYHQTNNQLQIFNYQGKEVRSFLDNKGEPWFIATDVSYLLGYRDANNALRILDDEEKGTQIMSTIRGQQKLAIINESGLYSLILTSRKPEAKIFKKWITCEVLPSIRKTGSYGQNINLHDPKQLRILLLDYAIKIEKDQPKVEFYNKFINTAGVYNLQNAARALNKNPNLFIDSLKNTYLFYQGSALVPYQQYLEQGLFQVKSTIVDNKVRYQSFVTAKGIEYFAKRNKLNINLDAIEEGKLYEN